MADLSDSLRIFLDGRYHEVRERARADLARPDFAPVIALPTPEYRELVLKWTKALAATGETSLGYPVEYGGRGDPGAAVAAFETLGHGDLSLLVKVGVQFGLWGGAILHVGTERHHEAYLADTATMELAGCFAMTETGHGSNVQDLRTTATYDPDNEEFVVQTPDDAARKDYIGNAACHARMAAVFAQLVVGGESRGVHALAVPIRDSADGPLPGVRIEDCGEKLGLNGVDNGRLWFDGVRVPREALLDRYASVSPEGEYSSPIENPDRRFFTMIGTLIQGRVCVGGASISAAKSALTIATRWGLARRQFGPPEGGEEAVLLDYRAQQRRLMIPLARTYALHFAQRHLLEWFHTAFTTEDYPERERRELETMAAGIKAMATWHATATIQTCREACGGAGYLSENRFAALKADTDVFTTFEGDNTILLQLVAKALLTDYRDEFGELGPLGMVGFVAGEVVDTVVERLATRKIFERLVDIVPVVGDDEPDVLARGDHIALFAWREEHIVSSLARRLRRGMEDGDDAFTVFNDCQDHVLAAARAHVERVILESFVASISECEDEAVGASLNQLCDLYALSEIERDRGWFQEHERIGSGRSKAVTREVNRLCAEVRRDARELTDAFGIPELQLGTGIARAVPRSSAILGRP